MLKHHQKALDSIRPATLYVTATPIGNLADITLRALAVLQRADLVCAEDTRVTAQLLAAYGISAKLASVREHNEQQMADKIIAALSAGQVVAQVSDAGTPAVCDPGARLVARVREAGFPVVPVVGASAVMGALAASGLDGSGFCFYGFLPAKTGERRQCFERWKTAGCPIIVFETPHRIAAALTDLADILPDRRVMLAREISKTFETFLTGTPAALLTALSADAGQMRGEMVLLLHPAAPQHKQDIPPEAQRILAVLAAELPTRQAAKLASEISGVSKNALYDLALRLKAGG